MSIDMSQFYQVFFDESGEHLAEMESLLLGLDIQQPDSEELNAIFRAAHSIKGSAGTFGFTDLSEVTHILENLLDKVRRNEIALTPAMVDAFLEAGDLLKEMLAAHQGQAAVDPVRVETMCEQLRMLTQGAAEPVEAPVAATSVTQPEMPAAPAMMDKPRTYDIEFVPTQMAIQGGGLTNFLEELRQYGHFEVRAQPAAEEPAGFWHVRLTTTVPVAQFSEGLDFIADNDAWRVHEDRTVNAEGQTVFGLFGGEAPGTPDETRGYGFFDLGWATEPLAKPEVAMVERDAYGLFEPLPEAVAAPTVATTVSTEEDDGFGFFEPLPVVAETAPVAESNEGYGFFEPIAVAASSAGSEVVAYANVATAPSVASVPAMAAPTASVVSLAAAPAPAKPPEVKPAEAKAEPPKAAAASKAPAAGATDSSIRVSVEKVDQLINLVGELVITQAMLQQTATHLEEDAPESLTSGLTQLERNTRDLQESVMSIRMLPISFVFSRFPRVVRDISAKLGKQVELKTSGEGTELDKGLIERISDPLTHLIRNSLDHGIESPEARMQAGKPPVGTITLKASHQGGNIVIEVGDDGAGLNRQRILSKARERGMQVSDQMTDQEVFALIFEAGFSTAEQVTDVSGRGVGMDVVRKNIQALGGRIEIESMPGIGTRMTVRLPLTLAILDGMSIGVGAQTYILPLSCVIESIQPQDADIRSLVNQGRVIQVRGEYLPVVVLHELFNLPDAVTSFPEGIMVVLEADGGKIALFVDALLGQHQVVIKSLEANYRKVPNISGATIMGDGHVALILDASALAGHAKQQRTWA